MEINICFGLNDEYCQHCACTIASILYNSDKEDDYNIHILTDYISDKNKKRLDSLKSIRGFKIKYYNVSAKEFETLRPDHNLGLSSFFRLKAFELFKFDKVLYLDCDLIVRKDIKELYATDITDYYCAGVEDIIGKNLIEKYNLCLTTTYVNSGVLLINLENCRKNDISKKLFEFLEAPYDDRMADQDLLNYILQNHILALDLKWNCMYKFHNTYDDKDYYDKVAKDPSIIHYITEKKPWTPNSDQHLKYDYYKYLKMTPYYEEFMPLFLLQSIDNLAGGLGVLSDRINKLSSRIDE